MQRKTLFSILATAALGLVMAGPVNAGTNHKWKASNTNDDYHTAGNWNPAGVPGTGDTATINPFTTVENYMNPVLDDQNRSLGQLVIGSGYKLTVNGVKLTLDGAVTHSISGIIEIDATGTVDVQAGGTFDLDSANTHPIGGDILLSSSTSVLRASAATTLGPNSGAYGSVIGQDPDASIDIAGVTLTNNIVVEGEMTVQETSGTATFLNGSTGVVLANGNPSTSGSPELLRFLSGLTIDDADTGTPRWEATTDSEAVLQFNEAATGLDGDFLLNDCALFDINANITTSGGFTHTAGTVDASPGGVCFKWNSGSNEICGTLCVEGSGTPPDPDCDCP